jgi:hypothetical protein
MAHVKKEPWFRSSSGDVVQVTQQESRERTQDVARHGEQLRPRDAGRPSARERGDLVMVTKKKIQLTPEEVRRVVRMLDYDAEASPEDEWSGRNLTLYHKLDRAARATKRKSVVERYEW